VGAGLFEFGDVDGEAEIARLQHPLASQCGRTIRGARHC
jgi:hypothetical protein